MLNTRPDVLVLGAGGVLGEAWMTGVLAGIEDATGFDLRRCEYYVGTSAGSIVAATLVAGQSPRRPTRTGQNLVPAEIGATAFSGAVAAGVALARRAGARAGSRAFSASAPLVRLAVTAAAPGGALVRAALLRSLPPGRGELTGLPGRLDGSGVRFDGRLRVVAVDRRRGRRVVFGRPGSPAATVGQAVAASCSVPWLFSPVSIDGREYVDGGVWSPTNLDVAPAGRDTQVLCLSPTGGVRRATATLNAARGMTRSALSVETVLLRRRGAQVQTLAPTAEAAEAMGSDFMDGSNRDDVLAAGYAQGLALAS